MFMKRGWKTPRQSLPEQKFSATLHLAREMFFFHLTSGYLHLASLLRVKPKIL
jgi:hypothetical protein